MINDAAGRSRIVLSASVNSSASIAVGTHSIMDRPILGQREDGSTFLQAESVKTTP